MNIFVPILKADASRREVYGVLAEEQPDKANEVFDYATSKPYVQAWSNEAVERSLGAGLPVSFGNVRAQHSQIAAGKLTDITFHDDQKKISVVAKIVDDNEWKKVEEGIYTGFSIGGSYVKRWPEGKYTRYTAKPAEVSIVDNPCMAGAKFVMVKANGAPELRSFGTTSTDLAELRKQMAAEFEKLKQAIHALQERHSRPTRFVPNGVEKIDVDVELRKTLNNGKPLVPTPARTGAATGDDEVADELRKALDNGRRGWGNPFEGEDAGRPAFKPRESLTVVASGSETDAAGESSVRKRSKFEPR